MEPPKVRVVIKRLLNDGWELTGIKGDHRKFSKNGKIVIVPGQMGRPMKKGTYESIKRIVGW